MRERERRRKWRKVEGWGGDDGAVGTGSFSGDWRGFERKSEQGVEPLITCNTNSNIVFANIFFGTLSVKLSLSFTHTRYAVIL
jgi:hypothetical protein